MEGLLISLIATIPAENIVPLFTIIIIISLSFALFEKGKSASSPQRAFAQIVSKGDHSNRVRQR